MVFSGAGIIDGGGGLLGKKEVVGDMAEKNRYFWEVIPCAICGVDVLKSMSNIVVYISLVCERRGDIPVFLRDVSEDLPEIWGCTHHKVRDCVTQMFFSLLWGGNMREVQNVGERVFLGEKRKNFSIIMGVR